MSLRYHACGQCVVMHEERRGWYTAHFYDAHDAEGLPITTCPRCGEHLVHSGVTSVRPAPERTLRHWLLLWPDLRATLEQRLIERSRTNPQFYPLHAEEDVAEFERQLTCIAKLAQDLAAANVTRSVPPSESSGNKTDNRGSITAMR